MFVGNKQTYGYGYEPFISWLLELLLYGRWNYFYLVVCLQQEFLRRKQRQADEFWFTGGVSGRLRCEETKRSFEKAFLQSEWIRRVTVGFIRFQWHSESKSRATADSSQETVVRTGTSKCGCLGNVSDKFQDTVYSRLKRVTFDDTGFQFIL